MARAKKLDTNLSFKERLAALKNLPELFRLVWQSSPRKTILSFVLRIARSAMPVSLLYIGKLIIDQVVQLNRHGGSQHELWKLVVIEFSLAVLTDGLNRMINLVDIARRPVFKLHLHAHHAPCRYARPGPVRGLCFL